MTEEDYTVIEMSLDVPDNDLDWMTELAEIVENNTGEWKVDLRENEIVANWRKGLITASEAREQLGDLVVLQERETWAELQEEYKDDAETLRFMSEYGYVPFSFELEEWREDDDYPFDDAQKQQFIKERLEHDHQ